MRQCELKSKAMSYIVLVSFYVEPGNDFNVLLFKSFLAFSCSSKSFLDFWQSSTRLLIKWFLINKTCSVHSNDIFYLRVKATSLKIAFGEVLFPKFNRRGGGGGVGIRMFWVEKFLKN